MCSLNLSSLNCFSLYDFITFFPLILVKWMLRKHSRSTCNFQQKQQANLKCGCPEEEHNHFNNIHSNLAPIHAILLRNNTFILFWCKIIAELTLKVIASIPIRIFDVLNKALHFFPLLITPQHLRVTIVPTVCKTQTVSVVLLVLIILHTSELKHTRAAYHVMIMSFAIHSKT